MGSCGAFMFMAVAVAMAVGMIPATVPMEEDMPVTAAIMDDMAAMAAVAARGIMQAKAAVVATAMASAQNQLEALVCARPIEHRHRYAKTLVMVMLCI